MKKQLTVEIRLTNKCKLNCNHCLAPKDDKEMSKKLLAHVIARVKEFMREMPNYFVEISYTGGEPFEYSEFNFALDVIKSLSVLFCMITNGVYLFTSMNNWISCFDGLIGVLYISGDRFHLIEAKKSLETLKSEVNLLKLCNINNNLDIELLTPNENWIEVTEKNMKYVTHKEISKYNYPFISDDFKFIGIDVDGKTYSTMGFNYGCTGNIKKDSIRNSLHI